MRLLLLFHLLLSLAPFTAWAAVLAIDYGSDWTKASLMAPGVPFDVLLNKDSKRKIQSSIGWKQSDRLFGTDAFNLASRFPQDSFSSVKLLQGAPYKSDAVDFYKKISSADVVETDRHTAALRRSDGTEWSVEELIAMEFAYVKHLAEGVAGEPVTDVIVTVPPYYTQFERDAVVDAIEISGLRTLALIHDGTAVAVNYAMTRTFPKPENHVIFDAGASSIRATVARFETINDATQITVTGVGYDRTVGGTELDRRLRELLVEAFTSKHRQDIRGNARGMARLWKEAGRVKAILSANTEAFSSVESVIGDVDFKTKVTRSSFEAKCSDLKGKFAQPILDAVKNAGLALDDITSVIMTGGSMRTPMIQAAVKAAVGEDKLAYNVNADESAVLGAALYGASLSRQFKTKNIKISDINVHDVQATYFAAATAANAKPRTITTVVYPAGSKLGSKKTMTFKRKEDFNIFLDYKNQVAPGFATRMLEAELTGVQSAIANLTERGAVDPVVKATVTLSDSGFVAVKDAIAYGEVKDESLTGKLKNLFGAGSGSSPEEASTEGEGETATDASASPSATATGATLQETIPLNITTKFPVHAPMSVDEKKKARSRLRMIDTEEAAKNRREEARNSFESYLYRLRDLLDEDNDETPFMKCSQARERLALQEQLDKAFEWLHEYSDVAETSQFLDQRSILEVLEKPIIHRYQEIEAFPQALNNSQMWNWSTRLFLTEAKQNLTAEEEAGVPSKWTREELADLEKTLKDHEKWLAEWVEKQKSVPPNQDPVIETAEMRARAKVLEQHLQKLWKRKAPKPKKTKASAPPEPSKTAEAPPEPEQDPEGTPGQQEPIQATPEQPHDEL
ncbi:Hsp70 protein-domain-containing protein [Schizophyllum commune]